MGGEKRREEWKKWFAGEARSYGRGEKLVERRSRIEFSRILAARCVGRRSRNSSGECSRLEAREASLSGPGPRSPEYWRLAIIKNSKKETRRETPTAKERRDVSEERSGTARIGIVVGCV